MMVVVFSHSVMPNSLRPHSLLHARLPCLSPTPRAYSNSCPLSLRCHPTISSSVVPFFFRLQSFPASVFSDELALCIRWPKYWSFSLSISLSRISWLSAVLGVLWPVAASFQWLPLPSRGCLRSVCLSLYLHICIFSLCVYVSVYLHGCLASVCLSLYLHMTVFPLYFYLCVFTWLSYKFMSHWSHPYPVWPHLEGTDYLCKDPISK